MRVRSFLIAIGMVTALALLNVPAQAQPPAEFERVAVWIWPEYDRPEALIIYNISLTGQTSLPAEVEFRIPQSVGRPNAVAMKDVDGSLVNLSYTSTEDGDWTELSFTTPVDEIQIEYYDNSLKKEGPRRSFVYEWPGFFSVNDLRVQIQQPVGATQMVIAPSVGGGQTGADGLTYYNVDLGRLDADAKFSYKISYQKNSDDLSVNSQPVEPAQPIDQNTLGRQTMQEVLPWVLGGLGLLLIVGGAIWYWQSGRDRQPSTRRRRVAVRPSEGAPGAEAIYCHQCGKRASTGDVFCRTCGTRLRV